ncbi:MAG: hypothetical protein D6732_10830, partial [Methanobacteriota archaeon]
GSFIPENRKPAVSGRSSCPDEQTHLADSSLIPASNRNCRFYDSAAPVRAGLTVPYFPKFTPPQLTPFPGFPLSITFPAQRNSL